MTLQYPEFFNVHFTPKTLFIWIHTRNLILFLINISSEKEVLFKNMQDFGLKGTVTVIPSDPPGMALPDLQRNP